MSGNGAMRRPPPPNPATYREDCWSEGETSALVDAWGDRYVELDRGYLRQNHWQEVADAVNSYRRAAGSSRRPPRTGVQCKNRIDTLKKKYKAEKAKVVESGGAYPSRWSFYSRLDALINESGSGASPSSSKKPSSSSPGLPVGVPLIRGRESPLPPPAAAASRSNLKRLGPGTTPDSFIRKGLSSVAAAAAAAAAAVEKDDEADSESSRSGSERRRHHMKPRPTRESSREESNACDGVEDGVRELARAISRFGEIYEKVEIAKQQQMMELENQRLEFAKGLEFQRMQMFIDSQVQLEKIKRSKRTAASPPCPDYM